MSRVGWIGAGAVLSATSITCALVIGVLHGGVSARDAPGPIETGVARQLRHLAIPSSDRNLSSPVPPSAAGLASGRDHWADHCAVCHGNDGRGDTAVGRGLYPKAPDMRLDSTQRLSDGELFFIIENGVRFTGMPGWGGAGPDADEETWHLVEFVRHLPSLTPAEVLTMEQLNPKTPAELADRDETREFLDGDTDRGAGEASSPAGGAAGQDATSGSPNPD